MKPVNRFARITTCIFVMEAIFSPLGKSGCDFRAMHRRRIDDRHKWMGSGRNPGKHRPRKLSWSVIVLRENMETKGRREIRSHGHFPFIHHPVFFFFFSFSRRVTCFNTRVCASNCISLDCSVRVIDIVASADILAPTNKYFSHTFLSWCAARSCLS